MENREYYESITTERAARAVISAVAPPGDFTTPYVLAGAGSGFAALRLAVNDERIEGLGAPRAHLWRRRFDVADTAQIRASLDRSLGLGRRVLIPGDADWPAAFDIMHLTAPAALWAQGNTSLLSDPLASRAAIIGSDTPSQYAAHVADELAGRISADGRTVVAQPLRGVAATAASSALRESSQVITVVPYGLDYDGPDREFPHSRVAEVGLLVSERPPGSRPYRVASMSSRNLIAALSGATTVVESPSQSEWMQIASIPRSHMWNRSLGQGGAAAFEDHALERFSAELRPDKHAIGPGDLMYLAVCEPCGWHDINDTENAVVEAWHDHAVPGWRELPVVPAQVRVRDEKGLTKFAKTWIAKHYPKHMQVPGAPIITERANAGTRHVGGYSPWGGYDLSSTALDRPPPTSPAASSVSPAIQQGAHSTHAVLASPRPSSRGEPQSAAALRR